jgi:hypothetical protein
VANLRDERNRKGDLFDYRYVESTVVQIREVSALLHGSSWRELARIDDDADFRRKDSTLNSKPVFLGSIVIIHIRKILDGELGLNARSQTRSGRPRQLNSLYLNHKE